MASDILAISDCEHVANTQQDTASIVLLLQIQAMSATPQVPKLPPKHVCCVFFSYHPPVVLVSYSQHISGSDQEDLGPEL
jgi:hypothetical protein